MKKFLCAIIILALCITGVGWFFKDEIKMFSLRGDLQALLDYAATTPEKTARLFGLEYRLEKPVILTDKHNGLKIDGMGATVSGMRKISGWRKSECFNGAWEADVAYDRYITSLFINGKRAGCAKLPKKGRFLAHSRIEDGGQFGAREGMFACAEQGGNELLKLSADDFKSAFLGTFRNWVQVNIPLKSAEKVAGEGGKIKVMFGSPLGTSMFRNCKYPNFIIYNIPNALSEAGEFFFDRAAKKIYYIPRAGEDMQSAAAEFPFVEIPFVIAGKLAGKDSAEYVENISIKGVSFIGGSVGYDAEKLKEGKLVFLCDGQSAAHSIACVKAEFAKKLSFENCSFSKTDSYGLWLGMGVKNASVKNCVFTDLGLGGMKVGAPIAAHRLAKAHKRGIEIVSTSGIEIADNLIYNFGRFSMSGAGILAFDAARCKIEHNEIFDGFYTGISYGWCWGAGRTYTADTSISFNKIHDLSFGNTNDLGGIYTLGTSPRSKIEGNVIENIECLDYGAWGIYNDEGSSGWSIFGNYVRNSSKGGYFMHYGSGCRVFNNIIRDCRDYQTGLGRKEPNSMSFERNIVEFSAPATILRGSQIIPLKAGKFESNAYVPKNCEAKFGSLTFEQWQKTGQDKGSIVLPNLDVDSIVEKKLGFEKIGFKPIDVSLAGTRGEMAEKAAKILKGYKYPEILKHNFKLPTVAINENFIGRYPAANFSPAFRKHLTVRLENGARFVRVEDNIKGYSPYFHYKFALDDYNFIEFETTLRLAEKSSALFEFRGGGVSGAGMPQARIDFGKMGGRELPKGKWLKITAVLPNHVNPDKKVAVKVYDGENVILEKVFPYSTNVAKYNELYVISPRGGQGEYIDIANIKVNPKK